MATEQGKQEGPLLNEAVECDIVAFMAHPDDAELQCGGTLALAVARGSRAAVVDFSRGELATRGTPEQRDREAEAAARELGLCCRVNLGLPDGHIEDTHAARKEVVRLLRIMRPKVVIAPALSDHHPDHMAVAQIIDRSFYLAGIAKYLPELEPSRPNTLLHTMGTRPGVPSLVVDISEVYEIRKKAIACYGSQLHKEDSTEPRTRISHPEFNDWVEGGLRHFGFFIGASYGEGFTSPMPVPVSDPVKQYSVIPWKNLPEEN
jgi:bacillithiol biosynthesis deacetylase BshB1